MQDQNRAWVATRKGLFELRRRSASWAIERSSFLGEPVSMVLPPQAGSPRLYAALNLGHFGVKLHGSDDAGQTWQELAAPAYPPQPGRRAGRRRGLEARADLVAAGSRGAGPGRHAPRSPSGDQICTSFQATPATGSPSGCGG